MRLATARDESLNPPPSRWQIVGQNLTSRHAITVYHWLVVVAAIVYGLFVGNLATMLATAGVIVVYVGLLTYSIVCDFLLTSASERRRRSRYESEEPIIRNWVDYLANVSWAFGAIVVSTFIYAPMDMGPNGGIFTRGVAVVERLGAPEAVGVGQAKAWVFTAPIPGLFNAHLFPLHLDAEKTCVVTLGDGARVQARVKAKLDLVTDGVILAYGKFGSGYAAREAAGEALQARLQDVVMGFSLTTMPSSLVLENKTADASMEEFGYRYAGAIIVSDIHAYTKK